MDEVHLAEVSSEHSQVSKKELLQKSDQLTEAIG